MVLSRHYSFQIPDYSHVQIVLGWNIAFLVYHLTREYRSEAVDSVVMVSSFKWRIAWIGMICLHFHSVHSSLASFPFLHFIRYWWMPQNAGGLSTEYVMWGASLSWTVTRDQALLTFSRFSLLFSSASLQKYFTWFSFSQENSTQHCFCLLKIEERKAPIYFFLVSV